MWTLVTGRPSDLWVRTDECRLPNGERAFVDEFGEPPPLPDWYVEPRGSQLRDTWDSRIGGERLWEHRSMCCDADYVVSHYLRQIKAGSLEVDQELFGRERMSPGFSAENAMFSFSVDVYERDGLSFWTTGLETEGYKKTKWAPRHLTFVRQSESRIWLRDSNLLGKDDCWAPLDALRDLKPPEEKRSLGDTQQILWSSLPNWLQFDQTQGQRGRVSLWGFEKPLENWVASIFVPFDEAPRSIFERCLSLLERHGFDASGTDKLEHSFFVSSLNRGRWLSVQIKTDSCESAGVGIEDTAGYWRLHASYAPRVGTPPPEFAEWID